MLLISKAVHLTVVLLRRSRFSRVLTPYLCMIKLAYPPGAPLLKRLQCLHWRCTLRSWYLVALCCRGMKCPASASRQYILDFPHEQQTPSPSPSQSLILVYMLNHLSALCKLGFFLVISPNFYASRGLSPSHHTRQFPIRCRQVSPQL